MKLKVIKNPVYFDVDETLILWPHETITRQPNGNFVSIHGCVYRAHNGHVREVKKQHALGHSVVVWSKGGAQWAVDVVKALHLESYVTLCIDKPTVYIDDLPIEKWGATQLYYDDDHHLINETETLVKHVRHKLAKKDESSHV